MFSSAPIPRIIASLTFAAIVAAPQLAHADKKPKRLNLAQLLARAKNNPLSRAAHHATAAARARVDEASGKRLGELSLTSFLAPSPSIECVDAACTMTTNKDASVRLGGVYGGVRARWTVPVYTFGKLGAVGRAAQKAARASRAKESTLAGRVVVEVNRAYYGLKLARELRWMLEDGRDEIKKAQKKLLKHLAAGTGGVTVQDRLRLETLLAEVESRLVDARAAEANALAGIRLAVDDRSVDIDEKALEPVTFALAKNPAGYLSRARQHHPKVGEARAGLAALRALETFESRKWLPDLAVVAGVNYAAASDIQDAPSAFYNDPYNTLGAGVSLVLRWKIEPLVQRARVRRARANARRASALLEGAILATDLAVRRAHIRAVQAQKRLLVARGGEKSAKGWVASVLQAEAIGVISAKDTSDAYVAYFTARARVLQSLYDWNLAVVNLRRVIGEFTATPKRPNK